MRLVLSRKGFDSTYGGIPSPILPDGRLIALPIPSSHDSQTFNDINVSDIDFSTLLYDLSRGRHQLSSTVHLDPDLDRHLKSRQLGWRPALGQTGSAQGHLAAQNVGPGDVFMFFGWFREVELSGGSWRYVRNSPHLHILFGWLEVDRVLSVVTERNRCLREFPWIINHPHVVRPDHYENPLNHLYIATEKSRFTSHAKLGGGRFPHYSEALRLSKPDCSRSVWALPRWFMPNENRPPLSYHPRGERWKLEADNVQLRSAAKGQEFVLDGTYYPELEPWLKEIIERHS